MNAFAADEILLRKDEISIDSDQALIRRDALSPRSFLLTLNNYYINHSVNGKTISLLEAAQAFNLGVFTSVPLLQGKLLTANVIPEFGDYSTSVRLLQFVRSTPGVTAPLIGQKSESHVTENMNIMKIPPLSESEFHELLKKMVNRS